MAASGDDESASPFVATPAVVISNGASFLFVTIAVPAEHHIYKERLGFELDGVTIAPELPPARRIQDRFGDGEKEMYERDFVVVLPVPALDAGKATLTVHLQGCDESSCYFPETRQWMVYPNNTVVALTDSNMAPGVTGRMTDGFQVQARASGFLDKAEFMAFLDRASGGPESGAESWAKLGMLATLGLILLGGLALNLTPCVLPMIPINLAILGVGAQNQSRRRGFALGAAYGAGMTLAYGTLGIVVVLTGSKFGTLNSSWWFNVAVGAVFVVLGFAMFDKVPIDFSRFQRSGRVNASSRLALLGAGTMGSIAALLAGACVAPVVISVLLLAASSYQQGNMSGLLLPLVLGLGMALPWPFAAAGLSFLPKPGAWMVRVKKGFGVLIFGFALWYGWLGLSLAGFGAGSQTVAARERGLHELQSALEQSRATRKPVLVDFWASWCKNCQAMEHSTFRDPEVRRRLDKDFIVVKFQAERLSDPLIKPVLDEFAVPGLPTCVVLTAHSQ
jgi:thiol:disulfide interchange protein